MSNYIWDSIKRITMKKDALNEKLKTSNIVLFGARMNGSFAYERMKKQYKIYAFSDNNKKAWGGIYEGVPVIEPSKLKNIENILVIITVSGQHYQYVKRQLNDMEITYFTYAEYILINYFDKFEMVYYELLEDRFSKRVYENLLMSYLKSDMTYLEEVFTRNQYFALPEFCIKSNKEVFVDCGAYTGDTLEDYITTKNTCFKEIYSFEPTETVFLKLCEKKERLLKEWGLIQEQIVVERKIIASKSGMRYFVTNVDEEQTNNRAVSKSGTNCEEVKAVSLDEYFLNKERKPTFIKADIEGSEMELLEGAISIIREEKPLLAICIYHRIEDLYEIPIFIKKINPEYKMSIRHHSLSYWETVLYCY